jgi:tetratricopeptide (TPR) repeat protein
MSAIIIVLAACVPQNLHATPPATGADEATLLQTLSGEDIDAVITAVSQIDVDAPLSTRTLAALVGAARKCSQAGRHDESGEIYHTAAAVCEKQITTATAAELPAETAITIWNSAASALTAQDRHADALRWSTLAADSIRRMTAKAASNETITRTGETLLAVAAGALDTGDKLTAGSAYRLATELWEKHASESNSEKLATARLGYAWTLVMAAGESGDANHLAESLVAVETFLKHHASHPDAPSALLLKLSCQTQLKDHDAAASTGEHILVNHPQSSAACEVIKLACASDEDLPEPLRVYLIEQFETVLTSHVTSADVNVCRCGLITSAIVGAPSAENAYAMAISLTDETGEAATVVLESLHRSGHDASAQRIALQWLSARDESRGDANSLVARMQNKAGVLVTTGVREAACRWAGRTGQWTMLALAAADEPGLYDDANNEAAAQDAERRGRSLHVERLFAEALLQTGKTKQSLKLWERVVDVGGANDFPTLLRLAEAATTAGSVTDASKRIAAAQATAMQPSVGGSSSGEVALTQLLAANLEIRQLQFDRGRALLEQVVRAPGAETDLRGRAQWMIGETFFMQEKFSEAIAAYRQVEAISGSDEWTAASLVQAGKSFEQLGRTREATMCYSTLVSRFGNSPHAGGARRRLAAMTSGDPSSPGMIRR